jgi:hypothetical protein
VHRERTYSKSQEAQEEQFETPFVHRVFQATKEEKVEKPLEVSKFVKAQERHWFSFEIWTINWIGGENLEVVGVSKLRHIIMVKNEGSRLSKSRNHSDHWIWGDRWQRSTYFKEPSIGSWEDKSP